jgi:hypothetical protein
MNVIFYSSAIDERSKEIYKGMANSNHNIGLELHHSTGSLEGRLRQPLHGIALMILYLAEKRDLADLSSMHDLFNEIPLILIMVDTTGVAMTKAFLLRPRVIFRVDDSLEDMCLVFDKMLARQISYEQQWKTDAL